MSDTPESHCLHTRAYITLSGALRCQACHCWMVAIPIVLQYRACAAIDRVQTIAEQSTFSFDHPLIPALKELYAVRPLLGIAA